MLSRDERGVNALSPAAREKMEAPELSADDP